MKDEQLDIIMKKHMKNKNQLIDIESSVMSRIKVYEEKKSLRLLYLEYGLSALVLFSGIASVFIIQYILILYRSLFEEYWNVIQIAAWIVTGIFVVIAFSSFWVIYFSRMLKAEKKPA
jgi:hypothetical protein